MGNSSKAPAGGGRSQRRIKNLLLDRHFQLKYTAYLVGIALVLSVSLGLLLWRVSEEVLDQSQEVVQQGQQVLEESQKVSAVVKMNIVKDPSYADNPLLLEAFQADASKQDQAMADQQRRLEANSQALEAQRRTVMILLIVALSVLVIALGLAGIVVTHKVAGPIYKMKRHIRELGEGSLRIPTPLRHGDELVHFFDAFNDTVRKLRERQEYEVGLLDAAIEKLSKSASEEQLGDLRALRADMQAELED